MSNIAISQLPLTTSVCSTALVPIVQDGVTCSTYACLLGSGGGGGVMVAGSGTCSIQGNGSGNNACGAYSFAASGNCNTASGTYNSVLGGFKNGAIAFQHNLVVNGICNCAIGSYSSVINGTCNIADCSLGFIGSGNCNIVCGALGFIGNGGCNTSSGSYSFIGGGSLNQINACFGNILGGCNNQVNDCFGTILGGHNNLVSAFSIAGGLSNSVCTTYSSIVSGCCNCLSGGGLHFIGGGQNNYILGGAASSILGGETNKMIGSVNYSSISGGVCNILCNPNNTQFTSSISGGYSNTICGENSFIGGGRFNTVSCGSIFGSILGGCSNVVSGNYAGAFGCGLTASADCTFYVNNMCVCGTLFKSAGSFKIPHPDPIKKEQGKFLRHSFVESPTAGDNIYRFNVVTCNCEALIDLPDYYKMLNGDDQVYVNAKKHLGYGFGIINEEQTQISINTNTDGEYNVLVIGTRKDEDALNSWNKVEADAIG